MKFLLVVIVFAVAVYLLVRVVQERGLPLIGGGSTPGRPARPGTGGTGNRGPRPSAPRRPRAPDDDEDFLRDLDRRRLDREDPEA